MDTKPTKIQTACAVLFAVFIIFISIGTILQDIPACSNKVKSIRNFLIHTESMTFFSLIPVAIIVGIALILHRLSTP